MVTDIFDSSECFGDVFVNRGGKPEINVCLLESQINGNTMRLQFDDQ